MLDFEVEADLETPSVRPAPTPTPAPHVSVKAKKERRAKLEEMRERFRRHLAERVAASKQAPLAPPPRYDDVFAEGMRWLDGVAVAPIEPTHGTLVFSEAVWKSGARRDPGIP
jgi:hypothetical protein